MVKEWWGYLKVGAPMTAMAAFFASLAWPWLGFPATLVVMLAAEDFDPWVPRVAVGIWLVFFCTFVGYFHDSVHKP